MTVEAVADAHQRAQDRLVDGVTGTTLAWWRQMRAADLDASWAEIAPRIGTVVATGQMALASRADDYTDEVLAEQGADVASEGRVNVRAFAGVASDGRDLEPLLYGAVTTTKSAIGSGATSQRALAAGAAVLEMYVSTQLTDLGRAADSVARTTRSAASGWVRMIEPGACSRCVVLAGKRFRWNDGFDRHPACRCTHVPVAEDVPGDILTDPRAYFDSLSEAEQDRAFTRAGARAIRDGADIGQVVNARRGALGLSQPGRLTAAEQRMLRGGLERGRLQRVDVFGRPVFVTTEGTTRRGVAGRWLGAWDDDATKRPGQRYRSARTPRLMPESIYEIADDREDAIRLLKRFGYII